MRLKDAKGLHYIAYLLARPGIEVFAGVLASISATPGDQPAPPGGNARGDLGDAGPMLDARAREQYRRRLADLDEELSDALRLNDTERAERLRAELEAVREQVAAAVGFGARDRKGASHAERARLMVTKAIKAALAKIRANDQALGRHLATSITTGTCCVYDPGPQAGTAWDL